MYFGHWTPPALHKKRDGLREVVPCPILQQSKGFQGKIIAGKLAQFRQRAEPWFGIRENILGINYAPYTSQFFSILRQTNSIFATERRLPALTFPSSCCFTGSRRTSPYCMPSFPLDGGTRTYLGFGMNPFHPGQGHIQIKWWCTPVLLSFWAHACVHAHFLNGIRRLPNMQTYIPVVQW